MTSYFLPRTLYGERLPTFEGGSSVTRGSAIQSTSGTWSGVVSETCGAYRPPALKSPRLPGSSSAGAYVLHPARADCAEDGDEAGCERLPVAAAGGGDFFGELLQAARARA